MAAAEALIRVFFLAGYHSSNPRAFDAAMDLIREGADLMLHTETGNRRRKRKGLRADGWRLFWPKRGAGECGLSWRHAAFHRIRRPGRAWRLTRIRFRNGHGALRPAVRAFVVHLQHRDTSRRVIAIAIHAPASVDGRWWFRGIARVSQRLAARIRRSTKRVAAAQDIFEGRRGLQRRLAKLRRRYPHAVIIVGIDTNLHLAPGRWSVDYLEDHTGLRVGWRGHWPGQGDLGKRLVGTILIAGPADVVDAWLTLRNPTVSDHRGDAFVVALNPQENR